MTYEELLLCGKNGIHIPHKIRIKDRIQETILESKKKWLQNLSASLSQDILTEHSVIQVLSRSNKGKWSVNLRY